MIFLWVALSRRWSLAGPWRRSDALVSCSWWWVGSKVSERRLASALLPRMSGDSKTSLLPAPGGRWKLPRVRSLESRDFHLFKSMWEKASKSASESPVSFITWRSKFVFSLNWAPCFFFGDLLFSFLGDFVCSRFVAVLAAGFKISARLSISSWKPVSTPKSSPCFLALVYLNYFSNFSHLLLSASWASIFLFFPYGSLVYSIKLTLLNKAGSFSSL